MEVVRDESETVRGEWVVVKNVSHYRESAHEERGDPEGDYAGCFRKVGSRRGNTGALRKVDTR